MERAAQFLPVIRDIFDHADVWVEGRERVMSQRRVRVFEHSRYQRLTRQAQAFLAGYIHRHFEERFGITETQGSERWP